MGMHDSDTISKTTKSRELLLFGQTLNFSKQYYDIRDLII